MRSNGSRHLLGNYIIIIAWSDYEWQLSDSKTLLLVPAAKCCTTYHSPPIRPRPLLFVFPAIVVGVAVAVVGEILIKTFARNRQGEGARDKERGRGRNEASKSVGRNINHNVGRGQEKLMKLSRCMRRLQPSRRVVVATTTPYGCLRCDQSCWRTCTRGAFGLPGCMLQLMLHSGARWRGTWPDPCPISDNNGICRGTMCRFMTGKSIGLWNSLGRKSRKWGETSCRRFVGKLSKIVMQHGKIYV